MAAQELKKLLFDTPLLKFNYLSIGLQHLPTQQSTSIMSCLEWQKTFISEEYARYDPIRLSMMNANRTDHFVYSETPASISRFGREIMQARHKMGIKDGIAFTFDINENIHAVMNLGTDSQSINLNTFIRKNRGYIDRLFEKGMKIFLNYGDNAIIPLISDDTQLALSSQLSHHR
ncbi:Autoinducer binding domain protein [Piscirickettsiaceae bacterium NZ-RLO1]|nr:Autoinducer binding domain protein [Piscirickettsiaceae bacterium NZ-RLO1]